MDKTNEELDCCAFCLMSKKDEVILLCKHSFCFNCMEAYCEIVRYNRRCPVCRKSFSYYEKKYGKPLIVIVDEDEDESNDDDESESENSDYDDELMVEEEEEEEELVELEELQ